MKSARRYLCALSLSLALIPWAQAAQADPCQAIPASGRPLPNYLSFGSAFSGPIVHVIDGDSLCVAVGEGPANWVEVRTVGFYAPELSSPDGPAAKAALERIAVGKTATCVANMPTYDRIAARCHIDGQDIGDLMRRAGVSDGGNGLPSARGPTMTRRDSAPAAQPQTSSGYRSCAAARAAGAAPMRRGEPGYNPYLDGDGDGIACERYRARR